MTAALLGSAGGWVPSGLAAVAVVAAVVNWAAVWTGGPAALAVERLSKPLVMAALTAAVVLGPVPTGAAGDARPWLIGGLVASLAGDVLLLPPGRFVPGLAAFLAAHLAYLGAFLVLGAGDGAWLVAGLVAGVVVAGTVGRVLLRAARSAGLERPVAAYLVVITLMAVSATRTGEPAAIAGAWLFVASDALLAWRRFRVPSPGMPRGGGRATGTLVMVTYHLAQALITVALVA